MSDERDRRVEIGRIAKGSYEAVNPRGGRLVFGTGDDESFTPVELLLAAIAGCGAADVDYITVKRSEPDRFTVTVTAQKVRDENGNHLADLEIGFDIGFPEGEAGDAARQVLPEAVRRSHDRLCTVSRTVELGTPVAVRLD
jgi:putative redox protein